MFGIFANMMGFVSVLIKIMGSINMLRDIISYADKAPSELNSLVNGLSFSECLIQ
ncbi:hypothetical protein BGZ60DRAFT_415917 [Tricladium varicosporioides]|nr:hypothetical protein BGZ60DRAFT_415917 [Hymenoscyphus varicosporioides]